MAYPRDQIGGPALLGQATTIRARHHSGIGQITAHVVADTPPTA
jgi:hypothetical protein